MLSVSKKIKLQKIILILLILYGITKWGIKFLFFTLFLSNLFLNQLLEKYGFYGFHELSKIT